MGGLLFALWLVTRLLPWGISQDAVDMASHIEDIERFLAASEEREKTITTGNLKSTRQKQSKEQVEYFTFDPNELPVADWKRLGLTDKQIRVIKNYEAKGGQFWRKEDLKKIYSLHDTDYTRLEPYIRIQSSKPIPNKDTPKEVMLSIELNSTDSLELQQLPGIGPVYASRIVRFRDRLGGFHQVSQLMDIYGMDSVRFDGLKEYIYVDSSRVEKIEINRADYERLKDHPFISPKLANAMVQYRKQHGHYQSLPDLLQIAIMDEGIFRKIAPYLTISDD